MTTPSRPCPGRVGSEPAARMGTATPLRVSPERCPVIVEFVQLPVRSITTAPDAHCVSLEVDADACVANQQGRDPRRHRSRHRERVR